MKLLICTQAVDRNDPALGFFCDWIEEFAKNCDHVNVICLREGEHALPQNVRVFSLGKEKVETQGGAHAALRLRYAFRFWHLIWRLRKEYAAVFVHMNPEYVVLGGPFWRITGKRISLWYTHKQVDFKLRVAVKLAHVIFTASAESFRYKTSKLHVMGHGIAANFFKPHVSHRDTLRLITISRIAPAKRIKEMIAAAADLYGQGKRFTFAIVGAPGVPKDEEYLAELKAQINNEPYRSLIEWRGPVPHKELPALLEEFDIFLNLSATGSMDKAVLEAMASGLTVLSNNEAFRRLLEPHGLFLFSTEPHFLAETIVTLSKTNVPSLAPLIKERHSLERLIPSILSTLRS